MFHFIRATLIDKRRWFVKQGLNKSKSIDMLMRTTEGRIQSFDLEADRQTHRTIILLMLSVLRELEQATMISISSPQVRVGCWLLDIILWLDLSIDNRSDSHCWNMRPCLINSWIPELQKCRFNNSILESLNHCKKQWTHMLLLGNENNVLFSDISQARIIKSQALSWTHRSLRVPSQMEMDRALASHSIYKSVLTRAQGGWATPRSSLTNSHTEGYSQSTDLHYPPQQCNAIC